MPIVCCVTEYPTAQRKHERFRHDAENHARLTIEHQLAADDRGIMAQAVAP
jgi:hypothetical protein